MRTVIGYDDGSRRTRVRHEANDGSPPGERPAFIELIYTFAADGLLLSVTETDEKTVPAETITAQVTYANDNRGRLTRETRLDTGGTNVEPVEYDIWYTYDLGGNRLTKTAKNPHTADVLETTLYDYDVSDENDGGQHNNRLLHSTRHAGTYQGPVVEERWYRYDPSGNVRLLVRRRAEEQSDRLFKFLYDNSAHLWMVAMGDDEYDPATEEITNLVYWSGVEYRYDGVRQRYLVRARDPNPDASGKYWQPLPGGQWRDYLGNSVYEDYRVSRDENGEPVIERDRSYAAGMGLIDAGAERTPVYFGADHLGTKRRLIGQSAGGPTELTRAVYTAFGEHVSDIALSMPITMTRYGYVGGQGYEGGDCLMLTVGEGGGTFWCDPLMELGWLHVGERYYDPSSGRFVQRDPIGIRGDLNTYRYAGNLPAQLVDPEGKWVVIALAIIIVLDGLAEWANGPDVGDPIYAGNAPPGPLSVAAATCLGASPAALPGSVARFVGATQESAMLTALVVFPLICGTAVGFQRLCTACRTRRGRSAVWLCVLVLFVVELRGPTRRAVDRAGQSSAHACAARTYENEREWPQASLSASVKGLPNQLGAPLPLLQTSAGSLYLDDPVRITPSENVGRAGDFP